MHHDPYLPESHFLSEDQRAWYRDERGWNCDPVPARPILRKLFQTKIHKR